jgi:hypothetical protein
MALKVWIVDPVEVNCKVLALALRLRIQVTLTYGAYATQMSDIMRTVKNM